MLAVRRKFCDVFEKKFSVEKTIKNIFTRRCWGYFLEKNFFWEEIFWQELFLRRSFCDKIFLWEELFYFEIFRWFCISEEHFAIIFKKTFSLRKIFAKIFLQDIFEKILRKSLWQELFWELYFEYFLRRTTFRRFLWENFQNFFHFRKIFLRITVLITSMILLW